MKSIFILVSLLSVTFLGTRDVRGEAGEKVVVFCHYRVTGRVLVRHISTAISRRLDDMARRKLDNRRPAGSNPAKKRAPLPRSSPLDRGARAGRLPRPGRHRRDSRRIGKRDGGAGAFDPSNYSALFVDADRRHRHDTRRVAVR